MNFNQAIIAGYVVQSPELRSLTSGTQVCELRVATHRVFTSQGQKQEETEFHSVVCWGRQAEILSQYAKKGTLILVRGRLRTRNWVDKSYPDIKHYKTEIVADTFELGPKMSKQPAMPAMPGPEEGESGQVPL